jgi:Ca-activated chloride channel homolog
MIYSILFLLMLTVTNATAALQLKVQPANPLLLENQTQNTIIQIELQGDNTYKPTARLPVNISLVVDRSGSMNGERIQQARQAAITVLDMLQPQDIFGLVVYSDQAYTLIHPAPVGNSLNRMALKETINSITSQGGTALFAGVSKGLQQVRLHKSHQYINRVILLSDGIANVGPSSPAALAALGHSAGKEGISVTTIGIGLGYNEDLMFQLASASEGNHAFVENSKDLARVFQNELGGLFSIVAQKIQLQIQCPAGVKPVQVLDQDAEIRGQTVHLHYNQMYGQQNKVILLEVQVPKKTKGESLTLANVSMHYTDPSSNAVKKSSQHASVQFTPNKQLVRSSTSTDVVIQTSKAKANIASKQALAKRDDGDYAGAKLIMDNVAQSLNEQAQELEIPELLEEEKKVKEEALELSAPAAPEQLNRTRKKLKAKQYQRSKQFNINSYE